MRLGGSLVRANGTAAVEFPEVGLDMMPGDVLCIRGRGDVQAIGRTGGFLGHVLIVMEQPTRVFRHTVDGRELESVWPSSSDAVVWKVPTLESTRGRAGLHRAEMVLQLDPTSRRLLLIAEMVAVSERCVELSAIHDEVADHWCCPAEFRGSMHLDLFQQAMEELYDADASWSYTTAARAVLRSAVLPELDPASLLEIVEVSWQAPPICTSVIISLWQRYLCKVAQRMGGGDAEAAALLRRWMPLLADRALPGELLQMMQTHGWTVPPVVERQEQAAGASWQPMVLPSQRQTLLQAPLSARATPSARGNRHLDQVTLRYGHRDVCADLDFRVICDAANVAECMGENVGPAGDDATTEFQLEGASQHTPRLRRLTFCC